MDNLFSNLINNNTNKNSKLIQKQNENQQNINKVLEQTAKSICGPACQKQNKTNELKQQYMDAQTNAKMAPVKVEETKRNYYVFSEGPTYYDNMRENELKKQAETISKTISQSFNDELLNANTLNSYLNTAIINSKHTLELYNRYLEENESLTNKLKDSRGDILTNDRKTYYETDALDRLKGWYKLIWYIYYLLVLVLIIAYFLTPNDLTIVAKIAILVVFLFYPYYISILINYIYSVFKNIYNNLPKNVYNNL